MPNEIFYHIYTEKWTEIWLIQWDLCHVMVLMFSKFRFLIPADQYLHLMPIISIWVVASVNETPPLLKT
jgi:hypothetical protein